jgi:hypothetical protein
MHGFERHGVAERIRGLVGGAERSALAATADRLRVSELALRMSIDTLSPQPTVDVLLAVIRDYGVDPTWLLTGEYDPATHRRAVDDDSAGAARALEAVARKATPSGAPMSFSIEPPERSATL